MLIYKIMAHNFVDVYAKNRCTVLCCLCENLIF